MAITRSSSRRSHEDAFDGDHDHASSDAGHTTKKARSAEEMDSTYKPSTRSRVLTKTSNAATRTRRSRTTALKHSTVQSITLQEGFAGDASKTELSNNDVQNIPAHNIHGGWNDEVSSPGTHQGIDKGATTPSYPRTDDVDNDNAASKELGPPSTQANTTTKLLKASAPTTYATKTSQGKRKRSNEYESD